MNDVEYGYIDGGTLISRFITEYRDERRDKDGVLHARTVTVEEQVACLSDEWKPVDRIDGFMTETSEPYRVITPVPYDAGTHIAYQYVKRFDVQAVKKDIQAMKDALTASDYKVAKCYEAYLLGGSLPYDIQTVHSERQTQRDKINELEELLEDYQANMITI